MPTVENIQKQITVWKKKGYDVSGLENQLKQQVKSQSNRRPTTAEILEKYGKKIEAQLGESTRVAPEAASQEYIKFKGEMVSEISSYEKWAKSLGNLIKIKVAEKDKAKIQKFLDRAHLDTTPGQALTLAFVATLAVFLATVLITLGIFLMTGTFQLLLIFLGLIASVFIFYYTYGMPQRLANSWRLKASSQMVPAILYVVVFMKHTSNLERAIDFASQHLEGPLALDLKKIFYDVQVGRFSSVKDALDNYLEIWRDDAPEFIESFHLVESSLYEPSEARRVEILEKSLQVILDGIYEKMLRYSREIRSPLTNVYMLGIILPTLALALLPLASTLLGGVIRWHHVLVIFNILIPFFVFYLTSEVLLKRPGGYGEASMLELNPEYHKYKSKKPWTKAALIAIPLLIIGILPFLFQINFLVSAFGFQPDYTFNEIGLKFLGETKIFDFKTIDGKTVGPFGPLAVLLSLCIPLSIALFFSIAYSGKTSSLIKSRDKTKKLEEEFTNTLFQLGNRLGDGTPAEIAFGKVAESTKGQITYDFFAIVNQNVQQSGMSVEKAIFDPKRGAMIFFPSALISTSMKILVESVKKGLKVAARSLMSISEYVKNIDKINQRLRDLLAEVVSDMKSNMTFLAPLLAGIVVGLSAMITSILNKLQSIQTLTPGAEEVGGLGSIGGIVSIFNVTEMIPPYFLQVVIGLYIVEIIFILSSSLVTIDSGRDPLREKNAISKNLKSGALLYIGTAFLALLALTLLAGTVIGGIT